MQKIEVNSSAKINIGLNVISKRPDGFHNLETVFYPLLLSDRLSFKKSTSLMFKTNSEEIEKLKSNLVVHTIKLLEEELKDDFSVEVNLEKNIPIGAGLGGGSSNAAATLKALNKLFSLNLSYSKLSELALKLGSDVPYFLTPIPSLGVSRGEKLTKIDLSFSYPILIVNPGIQISTKWAFSKVIPKANKHPLKKFIENEKFEIEKMKSIIKNDFEKIVFKKFPLIKKIKVELYNYGAEFALMTGTGSTVYGIFKNLQKARKAEEIFSRSFFTYLNNPFEMSEIT